MSIEDERQRPRTVFPLAPEHRLDLFAWRARLPWLAPVVDAEYGSSTFTRADRVASYEVRVSTTGLLVREIPSGGSTGRSHVGRPQGRQPRARFL